MINDEEERKERAKRIVESLNNNKIDSSNVLISNNNNEEYQSRLERANSLINSINPPKEAESIYDSKILNTDTIEDIELPEENKKENKVQTDKKWYQKFLNKSKALENGYQFGDLTKASLGTMADINSDVVSGVTSIGENVVDIGANLLATAQDITGHDSAAKKTREWANKNYSEKIGNAVANMSPVGMLYNLTNGTFSKNLFENNSFEENSLTGETSDKVASLIGYTAGMVFGGEILEGVGIASEIPVVIAGRTLNLPTLAITSGMAGGLAEANSKGDNVTEVERWTKGISSGIFEGVTEGIFGMFGVGGSELTDTLASDIASKFSSSAGKMLAKIGIQSSGEAIEEFLSYLLNYGWDNLVTNNLGNTDFSSEWNWNEIGEEMALAFASSAISLGGTTAIENNQAIKSAEQQLGRKLTSKEKAQVTQEVISEAIQEKENIKFDPENNGKDVGNFYVANYTPDGTVGAIIQTKGKIIQNPNRKVNITPIIIKDNQTNTYNIMDKNTGVLIDTTPYESLLQAQMEFNSKMINLDDVSIKAINQKINNYTIELKNKTQEYLNQLATEEQNNTIEQNKNQSEEVNQTENKTTQNGNMEEIDNNVSTDNKSFEDMAFEAMSNTDDIEETKSPLDNRDIETIGKQTNVNAYQYDNPEVKPYFQEMAQMIGEDLAYISSSENRSTAKGGGTKLNTTTEAISILHNEMGYSYDQISKGLQNIIDDNGKENNAVSKKLELIIDEQLRNGYSNALGKGIAPNQDYINTITARNQEYEKQNNNVSKRKYQNEIETYKNTSQQLNKVIKNITKINNNILEGISKRKSSSFMNEYLKNEVKGHDYYVDGEKIIANGTTIGKLKNGNTNFNKNIPQEIRNELKANIIGNLENVIKTSKIYQKDRIDTKDHTFADTFDRRKSYIQYKGNNYEIMFEVGKKNGRNTLYSIENIKKVGNISSGISLKETSKTPKKVDRTNVPKDSITHQHNSVKSQTASKSTGLKDTVTNIQDFGEKIGGARKDTAIPRGTKKTTKEVIHDYTVKSTDNGYSVYFKGKTLQDGFKNQEEAEKYILDFKENVKSNLATVEKSHISDEYIIKIKNPRTLKTSYTNKKFSNLQDAESYAMALSMYLKEHGKSLFRPQIQKVERINENSKNATKTTGNNILNDFGFKGGEFGNWVTQSERQQFLNYAQDAFTDLATALNIQETDLGQNGDMSIAFGARGKGLSAAVAHFEPAKKVINMTRLKGAGSLAHEYGHSIDNWISRLSGNSDGMATENNYSNKNLSDNMKTAIREVTDAMHYNVSTNEEEINKKNEIFEKSRKEHLEYHLKYLDKVFTGEATKYKRIKGKYETVPIEITEQQKKEYQNIRNTLINGKLEGEIKYEMNSPKLKTEKIYPNEIDTIQKMYKEVVGRKIDDDTLYWLFKYGKPAKQLTEVKSESAYMKSAKELDDMTGRKSLYYSRTDEMWARAFEAYVSDKLKTKEIVDTYLVHSVNNSDYALFNPFPAGEERQNINKAFDNLIQTMKDEGILHDRKSASLNNNTKQDDGIRYMKKSNKKVEYSNQIDTKNQIKIDSENFAKQVQSVQNRTFPKNDMLTLLTQTPKPLLDIGLPNLPITMTQRHLDTIMNESGKYKANYHNLGIDIIKQLPEAISNPLDIVQSNTKDDSIVLTTYLSDKQDRTVIASIKIDGEGSINDVRIDTNVMTSAYGRNNYEKFMEENLKNGKLLYDIDRGVIKKVTGARLQLPRRSNLTTNKKGSSINNSISQRNKYVNSDKNTIIDNNMQKLQNNTSTDIHYSKADKTTLNAERTDAYIEQEIKKLEKTGDWDYSIPATSLTDIRKTIEDYLGLGIKKGHFRQSAYGIYKSNRDVIRTKEFKDMDSILHETGHALDLGNRLKLDKESIADELFTAIDKLGGYEEESRTVRLEEGFAEVIREYSIIPKQAEIDYPQSVAVIEELRNNDKSFDSFISKVQEQTYNYIHQNPQNRVHSNISIGEQTDKTPLTKAWLKQEIMRNIWDKDYVVKEAVKGLADVKGKTVNQLKASDNAYYLTRLASGITDKVTSMLADGYIDENGNKLMPGLNKVGEILGDDTQRYNDLRDYLVAKRDTEYKAKTLKTGIRSMDTQYVLNKFKNDTQIKQAANVIYKTLDGVMQYAVKNGLITEETVQSLKESNAFYVPMQRVIEGRGNQTGRKGAVSDIIKKRTGSELDVKDVLENIVANSSNIIQQVENNNVLKALYNQGEEAELTGAIYDVIPAPMIKIGTANLSMWEIELKNQGVNTNKLDLEKTIDLFAPNKKVDTKNLITSFINDNGKRIYLQFNDELLFNSLMNIDTKFMSQVLQINGKLNLPLRYGATMANLGFAIPNMISDTAQASIYSNAGFIPVVDNALGVLDVLTANNKYVKDFVNQYSPEYVQRIEKMYNIYKQTGSTSSTRLSQYRESTQNVMKDIYGTKNSEVLGIHEKFKPLKRLLDILTYIPELSEQSTRFRVFEKNYDMYKDKGNSEMDSRILAALESRDATQDFGRTGNLTREINQLIPFSAARVGSSYTFAEKVKANPKQTGMRIAMLTALAIAIKGIGYDDDEIEELNQRKKDDNFVLKIGNNVVTIKKPQGILRSMINLAEYIQDLATGHINNGKEGERLGEWITNAIMDNMPADSVTGLVPNMVAPLIENAINKDFYYNTDIVKSYDLDLPNSEQYYDYNSQLAILLGKAFNYSPAKIDNLISGYFAGLGTQVTNIMDYVSGKIGLIPEKPEMGAESNAVGKRFIVNVNTNSASIDEVYNRKTELTKKQNGGTITADEETELETLKGAITNLSKVNKQIKEIKADLTTSGKEKAEQIKILQQQKTDIARQALGKNLIHQENASKIETTTFYPSNSSLSLNNYKLELTSDMKEEYAELAQEYYSKYENQGLYSQDKLKEIKTKAKEYAKKTLMQKYRSQLVKTK